MNKITLRISAAAMVLCATAAFSQSKFSGIYSGKASNVKFLIALTKGGRALGANDTTEEGLKDVLDPKKSKVSKNGSLKAKTPGGASVVAKINTKGRLTGTIKQPEGTFRVSGKRIYN